MERAIVAWAAILVVAGCTGAESTAPTTELGREIARGSLTAVNGDSLPCCTVDSSGAQVTIVGGALIFYALAQYADSVATPAGWMSGACVQEVPNGAYVDLDGLLTRPDGSTYLLLPCSTGTYGVTLTQHLSFPGGVSRTNHVTVSSGAFTWKPDTLTIVNPEVGGRLTASMSGATITVAAPGRQYRFVVAWVH